MDATCTIQDSIHVFNLVHKYVSRILGTYQGLCRGVYVFVGRVEPVLRSEMCHIIHAEMLSRLFMGFSAGSLCIFNRNITASQEKLYLILRAALTPT